MSGGTVSVKMNNLLGSYIKSYKGVRQGDPLSPILFNFVADGLTRMNISLLCKWWWKLDREVGLWQKIVKFKYIRNSSIYDVKHRQSDSAIWADLLKVKDIYLQGRKILVRNDNFFF